MKVIFETFDHIQADFLKSELEAAGIAVQVYSPDMNGLRPSLAYVGPLQILVLDAAQAEAGRSLISQVLESPG